MKKYIVVILSLLLPLFVLGQTDRDTWDVYLAQYEKGVGSVVLNMSAKEYAPDRSFPYLVITGVTFRDCTPEGMPTKAEFEKLYVISDSVKDVIASSTKNISVGTFSYQCKRVDYYYVMDTAGIRQFLLNMYSRRFMNYQPYINIEKDQDWEAYLSFLYPNEETQEYMRNQKVVSKLVESGDKLEKSRQVDHWIYFTTEADRDCYLQAISRLRFKVEATEKTDKQDRPFKLQISREDKVDMGSITKLTLSLKKEAEKCNGYYDGWETFLVK